VPAPRVSVPALPAPSKKATAKLMTKGLVVPLPDEPRPGQKPRA
jgi:hypothetical protein